MSQAVTKPNAIAVPQTGETPRIVRGLVYKTVSSGVTMALGIATSVILNRHFGAAGYGLLVMVFTVAGVCAGLADFGLNGVLGYYLPRLQRDGAVRVTRFLAAAVALLGVGVGGFGALLWFGRDTVALTFYKRPELSTLMTAGVVYFAGMVCAEFVIQILQALRWWAREAVASIVFSLGYCLLVVVIVWRQGSLSSVLLANGAAAACAIGLGVVFLLSGGMVGLSRTSGEGGALQFRRDAADILRFGLPIVLIGLNQLFLMWFDKMLLGLYGTPEDLAHYYVGFMFFNGLVVLMKVAYAVLMPYLSGIAEQGAEKVRSDFQLIFRGFLHGGLLVSIVSFFLAEPVILGLYGSEYRIAVESLRWLLAVFLLRTFVNPLGMFVQNVYGAPGKIWVSSLLLVGSDAILGLLLIPRFGYRGAVITAVVSYAVYLLYFVVRFPQIRQMMPLGTIAKAAGALMVLGVVYGALSWVVPGLVVVQMGACVATYAGWMLITREVSSRDVALGRRVWQQIVSSVAR